MEVFVVVYKAEFDCEEFDDVYVYDTFDKAQDAFNDIIDGWLGEDLFNVEKPTCKHAEWDNEEYYGIYHNDHSRSASFYIEETDNVVNHLSIRIECSQVM